MKVPCSILVLLLFTLCAAAQTVSVPQSGSDVTVIEKKWRVEITNAALENEPITAASETEREDRQREETRRANRGLLDRDRSPTITATRREKEKVGLTATYIYELKIRNGGQKSIRSVSWDYVFLELGTETEIGRRRFVSKVNIKPGKTTKVIELSGTSPTGTVDARKVGKKPQEQYSEQIVIKKVEFADGSVWEEKKIEN